MIYQQSTKFETSLGPTSIRVSAHDSVNVSLGHVRLALHSVMSAGHGEPLLDPGLSSG